MLYLLLSEVELEGIQDRYVQVLRSYLEHAAPHHPGRLQELFARIPEVTSFFIQCTFSVTLVESNYVYQKKFVIKVY